MLSKVEEYVSQWHMLEKGDRVIVGVSGGADSVCLLFVLLELKKKIPFEIIVVHVNHGLRGKDADADEAYVKELCSLYELPFLCERVNVEEIAATRRLSEEEAGRVVRRATFARAKLIHKGTKIALAHHMNDNVETFFLNLTRGTGMKGLGGIRPVADDIIRPLLCLKRSEIEEFLKVSGIAYCTDVTNAEDGYTRNRIRNHIIPYLEKEVNLQTVTHVNELMEHLQEIQTFLDEQTGFWLQSCVKEREMGYILDKEQFENVPNAIKSFVLKRILVKTCGHEKDIESTHIEILQALLDKQVGRRVDLPYDVEAKRIYEGICVRKKSIVIAESAIYEDIAQCRILQNMDGNSKAPQKEYTKWFDYDIITDDVCIRTRRAGDYITIHPDGRTQKVKTFFINEKIPQEERDKILLVAEGNHILWIVGYRTNPLYNVRTDTKQILEIQINKGEDDDGRDN